ncbi:MAG: bacillithiol biosynthesis cysteine-adding enzyme BshC [Candidatus Aminicenantes bacterium]|nr:bacillithiol biosynthesis cysteine-adding enzyme BshC [Candidatus Aminicenantes bacterium]
MFIPTKRLPRLPRLVDDYFHDYGKVREFFDGDFRDAAAYERQTERTLARRIPREELAAILREQNQTYGCGPQTLGHIEALEREQACAVVTGQQAGLFSGPLYTIYKALTATKLAGRLSRNGPGKVIPVFWLASDDHDLAEIDHIVLLDKDNRLEEVRCRMPSGELKIPASALVLPPEIADCLRRLADLTAESEFKADIMAALNEAYRPGRGWVEAFARWMTRLFQAQGLIFIDASHPRLKELGREVFCREITEESAATPPALAASQRLRDAGYEDQVHLHEGILNIFYAERERRSLRWDGRVFEIKEPRETLSKEDLLSLANEKPFLFSPNVLLRPIYQDTLLPTVVCVCGPGEIAYFAQMKGVYERFGLPMPVIYPRKSLTVVEKKIGRILAKYSLDIPDLWGGADGIIRRLGKNGIPEPLGRALSLAASHLEQDFESLVRDVAAFEPTLKESAHLARRKMDQQLRFLEKKIVRAAKKRNDNEVGQIRKAGDNLYPNGHLQERVFNIVPYLLKYGPAFVDKLDEAIDLEAHDHQMLRI